MLATGEGGWAIQVGAFSREANARRAAEEAVSIVGRNLVGVGMEIAPLKGERGTLFRSRLTGLSASVARESCRILKAQGRDCLAVAPRG
jgi:D-alanyl-D-alanine carboxypeptidase